MTLIAELKYVAEWAQHHQDKAEAIKKAADAIEELQARYENATAAHEDTMRRAMKAEQERDALAAKLVPLTEDELDEIADACTPRTETGSLNYGLFYREICKAHGIDAAKGGQHD